MVATIEADLGAVGILINNAGIASRGMSVADTDPDELRRVVSTHAFAAHYLSKLVIPGMRGCDRGDIIMISSCCCLANNQRYGGSYEQHVLFHLIPHMSHFRSDSTSC